MRDNIYTFYKFMAKDSKLKKCKVCGRPLNSEIVSKKDPNLCFEDAEEPRRFSQSEEKNKH